MKLKKFNPALILGACLTFGVVGCSDDDDKKDRSPTLNIVELAQSVDDLSILVDAVVLYPDTIQTALGNPEADLTVFAPTNAAFSSLLESQDVDTLAALQTKLTADGLENVLKYHVLASRVDAAAATAVAEKNPGTERLVGTFLSEDEKVAVTATGNQLYINSSKVTTADQFATNGVVHIVDKVLLPVSVDSITAYETVSITDIVVAASATAGVPEFENKPEFTLLKAALEAADASASAPGLLTKLAADGTYTVFAPTDAAFTALLEAFEVTTLGDLVTELGGIDVLIEVLQNHVLGLKADSLTAFTYNGGVVPTLNDPALDIVIDNGALKVGENGQATVIVTNIQASNGVIHVIDTVITTP
jgi:uncharacterized surface protein with fasciclin (FAS1) repeats